MGREGDDFELPLQRWADAVHRTAAVLHCTSPGSGFHVEEQLCRKALLIPRSLKSGAKEVPRRAGNAAVR